LPDPPELNGHKVSTMKIAFHSKLLLRLAMWLISYSVIAMAGEQNALNEESAISSLAPEQQVAEQQLGAPTDEGSESAELSSQSLTASASSASSAEGRDGGAGMNFKAGSSTGQFTYQVPFAVPAGRQGAQPNVGLVYSSGGGNGICGVGWSLETGYIERNGKKGVPIKWSGQTPLAEYDDSKGFVLSFGGAAANLINIGANQYRAEIESGFLLIFFNQTQNRWEVTDKVGNLFYFGETSASRMENSRWLGSGYTATFRWALSKVIDVNGNKTDLSYWKNGGLLYPQTIAYNGNINEGTLQSSHSVTFNYTPTDRTDKTITYRGGYRVEQNRLLSNVEMRVSGQLVRKYVLGYTQSSSTDRTLLQSVTTYDSNGTTALPPITFNYQVKPTEFENLTTMGSLLSPDPADNWRWLSIEEHCPSIYRSTLALLDVDGDGLQDRAMKKTTVSQLGVCSYEWYFQRNLGSSFAQTLTLFPNLQWVAGAMCTGWQTGADDKSGFFGTISEVDQERTATMTDINGDGRLDRLYSTSGNAYAVQLNDGQGLGNPSTWSGIDTQNTGSYYWGSFRTWAGVDYPASVTEMMDINGDGLPDRVMINASGAADVFKIQLNTGSGFAPVINWGPTQSIEQGANKVFWRAIQAFSPSSGHYFAEFVDMNGDGLPDRVMRAAGAPFNHFKIQYNNGSGFEAMEDWQNVKAQGQEVSNEHWGGISSFTSDGGQYVALMDVNADGLIDRVTRKAGAPYTSLYVQFNQGSKFSTTERVWGPLQGADASFDPLLNSISAGSSGYGNLKMIDINGDGLLDRVLSDRTSPYTQYGVQLSKGPFPDLLSTVQNGIGGKVTVTYTPSTTFSNTNNSGRHLLPFPVYVASNVLVEDGIGEPSSYSYQYRNGFYDGVDREFRGFWSVASYDPTGAKTVTYYHQDGGFDDASNGEYSDSSSHAKKGMPYRVEHYGADGNLYSMTLNKVQEAQVGTTGTWFPYVEQTVTLDYPNGNTSAYRARAQKMTYDTTTGNVLSIEDLAEVTNVNPATHTFSDLDATKNLWTLTTYATIAQNLAIRSRPNSVVTSSTSTTAGRLRESKYFYDSRGNVISNQVWLTSTNGGSGGTTVGFITVTRTEYDVVGNPWRTIGVDGVTNTVTYDTGYKMYPVKSVTGTFTNLTYYDTRSGVVIGTVDPNGVATTNILDSFFRTIETRVNSVAFGAADLWRTKIDYYLMGVSGGISQNYTRARVFDANDQVNGIESYTYSDGLGRTIQTRAESETNNVYRVIDTFYDAASRPFIQFQPYFGTGSAFSMPTGTKRASYTEFDPIGRQFRVTPVVNVVFTGTDFVLNAITQDAGSPTAPVTTVYFEGTNPWVTIATDSLGKTSKSYSDEFGRTYLVRDIVGGQNVDTYYFYDLLGNLTGINSPDLKATYLSYNNLGWKLGVTDPNMGTWFYMYDLAGRLVGQEDNEFHFIKFEYNDFLGRKTKKEVYGWNGGPLESTSTYSYDVVVDPGHDVFKGQLARVVDESGSHLFGYDYKGRTLKVTRTITASGSYTGGSYTTQKSYDAADQLSELVYPSSVAASLKYQYVNGVLSKVESSSGTGNSKEVFYQLVSLNEFGQATKWTTHGNTVTHTRDFFDASRRLKQVKSTKGATNIQSVSYTFDAASNVKSIGDQVHTAAFSGSMTNLVYDDLHRLTSITYTAGNQTRAFSYNNAGNILVNSDFGSGTYTYSSQMPHAVVSANAKTYSYDYNGNMIYRNGQTLGYNGQNRLVSITGGGGNDIQFKYDDAGSRLLKIKGNAPGYHVVWVGDLYEYRSAENLELCHVFAGGQRVASFEPQAGGPYAFNGRDSSIWGAIARTARAVGSSFEWAFSPTQTATTVLLASCFLAIGALIGIGLQLGFCAPRRERRFYHVAWYHKPIGLALMVSLLFGTANTNVHASITLNDVFLYYITDHLGSSNITTQRDGTVVHHYEYRAFGKGDLVSENISTFSLSHRYTGQILDEDAGGLYYYGGRYYDPELGRFIQPDTVVPDPADSQALNRYAYCINNPVKYTDPTGHIFGPVSLLIGIAIGAAIGGATAAASGGNIGLGILTGAIGGLFGGVGAAVGEVFNAAAAGAIAGGAAGGAASAAITGGNVGMGALTGAISGMIAYGAGKLQAKLWANCANPAGEAPSSGGDLFQGALVTTAAGALGGGIGAELQGGDFWRGAAWGAAGGATAYGAWMAYGSMQLKWMNGNSSRVNATLDDGTALTVDFTSADQFVNWLDELIGKERTITKFEFNGHGAKDQICLSDEESIFWSPKGKFFGAGMGDAESGTINLNARFTKAFSPTAEIRLKGCSTYSWGSKDSIAAGFKDFFPNARVYGYKTPIFSTFAYTRGNTVIFPLPTEVK
jgi:RHS repeat-associated protein